MVKPRRNKTKKSHVIIFGSLFLALIIALTYTLSEGVVLRPENLIVHTNLVYYDGEFSQKKLVEDTHTALYVLNQSDEIVYATIFEYDKNYKEKSTAVQIMARQNQFIKTEGPGVVYLINDDGTSSSTVRFSRWATVKKYTIPAGFTF